MVGSDGVEPPESNDSRFTVCPASIYGITPHVGGLRWTRTTGFALIRRAFQPTEL